ncbi:hypothetical protein [Methanomethylovorans sp.]|uniref:hypothetical protein n=1 Tax=Methanomethylovorans sp. TaxID=2758717 RepID=UPI00345E6C00
MNYNKIHLLIPLILFSYLLIMNLQSINMQEKDGSYLIDVGSRNDMLRGTRLTGPEDRISEAFNDRFGDKKINFRNFTSRFVYFQLEEPGIRNASTVRVQIRFKDELAKGYVFKVGAHSAPQWNYKWNLLYDPFQRQLEEEYDTIYTDNNISVYSLNDNDPTYSDLKDFFSKLDAKNTLAIHPSVSLFPGTDKLQKDEIIALNTTVNTTLRGRHTFLTFVDGNEISVDIEKQDLNWYNGTDDLKMEIVSGTGETVASLLIPDDGDATDHRGLGKTQTSHVRATGLDAGTYKIIVDANDDTLIKKLQVSSSKLIAENNLFVYTPTKLFTRTEEERSVSLMTLHKEGLQEIEINNGNTTSNVTIDRIAVAQYAKIVPSSNLQGINVPAGDLKIASHMYFSFTEGSYFEPMKCNVIPLENNFDWLKKNNVDYVIMNNRSVISENGWVIAETEWNIDDLYIRNNVLDFSTNIEHPTDPSQIEIPVDWIRIILE